MNLNENIVGELFRERKENTSTIYKKNADNNQWFST